MADDYTTSNIRTNITTAILMRNFVTPLLFLTIFLVTACDSAQRETPNTSSSPATSSETVRTQQAEPVSDNVFLAEEDTVALDSLESTDTIPDEYAEAGWDDAYDDADIPVEYGDDTDWSNEMSDEGGEEIYVTDSYLDEDVVISKEKMIFSGVLRVIRPDFRDERDSVLAEIEKKLVISPERIPRTVVVEKWISPVNYRGYKFNRKKLVMYGVEKDRTVIVFYYLESFYLAMDKSVYELIETAAHAPFEQVFDADLVRHLLAYENSL